ncbi:unnamed protein product [Thlaspi arvense]|uniref:ERAP1-like C-terminal domain-containing protein n=1 Tax=Thlaspi arvense TaxID=13288 RepID=A0AAU9RF83_THLAR|nr:unnamed protein product [Thlaspi arvense]
MAVTFFVEWFTREGHWIVPLTLCCGSYAAREVILLEEKSKTLDLGTRNWIKVNVDQTGFYRVKYDEDLSSRLRCAIETKCLSPTDRFGILDDSNALCMACQQPLTSLLKLMSAYKDEVEYTVLSNLITISYKITRIIADAAPELLNCIKEIFIKLFQYPAESWDAQS